MSAIDIESLEQNKRNLPDKYEPLRIRIHRAISWLKRAKQEDKCEARFLFLWIGFNAAYLRIIKTAKGEPKNSDQLALKTYCQMLVENDQTHCIRDILQTIFPSKIISDKMHMQRHLEGFFWSLKTLRNRLIHGGNIDSEERKQIIEGTDGMEQLLPVFIDTMLRCPDKDWGILPYFIFPIPAALKEQFPQEVKDISGENFMNQPDTEKLQISLDQSNNVSSSLSQRLQNAISWLEQAEQETEDLTACFIFLWISFNAAYAEYQTTPPFTQIFSETNDLSEKEMFEQYLATLVETDRENLIFNAVWEKFYPKDTPHPKFLQNKYIFRPFWKHYHYESEPNWESFLTERRRQFRRYRKDMNTSSLLVTIFDRLYMLRNQLMHGSATWNSSLAREQVIDGVKIMGWLLPIFLDLTIKNPHEKW